MWNHTMNGHLPITTAGAVMGKISTQLVLEKQTCFRKLMYNSTLILAFLLLTDRNCLTELTDV